MTGLTDEQKTEYFRRSYTAVDGLWFMKVEEKLGFDEALLVDEAVWRVLPKIQARTLKGMMNLQSGLLGLDQALSARLAMEGFEFQIEPEKDRLAVTISRCPWHDIMIKSGRGELSKQVSEIICRVENTIWASEFSGEKGDGLVIEFSREKRICQGEESCLLRFCLPH
jgi:hypothetical protein